MNTDTIDIVGGVYHEYCVHPGFRDFYGSAGRAASAISKLKTSVNLHTYADNLIRSGIEERAAFEDFLVCIRNIKTSISFVYEHGLSEPKIYGVPEKKLPALNIVASKVIRFGMLEATAIIDAEFAVFDPQNVASPEPFCQNGSKAKNLSLVLNRYEAATLSQKPSFSTEEQANFLYKNKHADVIIIKQGPAGALICDHGRISTIPAYETTNVSKIGSGDVFVAHFAKAWMNDGLTAHEAADRASRATAYYCEKNLFPTQEALQKFSRPAVGLSKKFINGYRPKVYLAGPFFTLTQVWLIEQARNNLNDMGLKVFSPYHDVGHGSASDVVKKDLEGIKQSDIVFAIGDGLDSGTVYEVGYARALGIPVIFYSENLSKEDVKMMEGSGCILCSDYVTSIYKTLWLASQKK